MKEIMSAQSNELTYEKDLEQTAHYYLVNYSDMPVPMIQRFLNFSRVGLRHCYFLVAIVFLYTWQRLAPRLPSTCVSGELGTFLRWKYEQFNSFRTKVEYI